MQWYVKHSFSFLDGRRVHSRYLLRARCRVESEATYVTPAEFVSHKIFAVAHKDFSATEVLVNIPNFMYDVSSVVCLSDLFL